MQGQETKLEEAPVAGGRLNITRVGFGTAGIGGMYQAISDKVAGDTLEAAWQRGIRHFDTAPFYGFGLAERRLGDFLRGKPRGSYVLSTKVGRLLRPVPEVEVPDHGFVKPLSFAVDYDYSYDGIMRSLDFSFARLGLNQIDMLYVHDIGAYTHGAEVNAGHFKALMDSGFKALEKLRDDGTIKAFGMGVNEVQVCLDVLARTKIDCILLAGRHTLLDRSADAALLPLCLATGTSVVVGGVFNSGILATGSVHGANFNYSTASQEILDRVARLEEVARRHGVPLVAAALQYPLRHPAVAGLLFGAIAPDTVFPNMDLYRVTIPPEAWAEFDAAIAGEGEKGR
jgi:D-threo-aldose 1-dehydrogenase